MGQKSGILYGEIVRIPVSAAGTPLCYSLYLFAFHSSLLLCIPLPVCRETPLRATTARPYKTSRADAREVYFFTLHSSLFTFH